MRRRQRRRRTGAPCLRTPSGAARRRRSPRAQHLVPTAAAHARAGRVARKTRGRVVRGARRGVRATARPRRRRACRSAATKASTPVQCFCSWATSAAPGSDLALAVVVRVDGVGDARARRRPSHEATAGGQDCPRRRGRPRWRRTAVRGRSSAGAPSASKRRRSRPSQNVERDARVSTSTFARFRRSS